MIEELSLEMLVALGRLSEDEREVVVDRVIRGETLQRIADRTGKTREGVRYMEGKALAKLSRELEAIGYVR